MKTNKKYVINEVKYIEDIINSEIIPSEMSVYQLMKYLTTYYYINDIKNISEIKEQIKKKEEIKEKNKNLSDEDKLKIPKIKDERINILVKNVCNDMSKFNFSIKEYQEYLYIPKIKKLYKGFINAEYDVKLRNFDSIDIYQSEIKKINMYTNENKTKEKKMRKLLFTLYVMAHFEMRKGWINTSVSELFKLANITTSSIEKEMMIGELIRDGFVKDLKCIDKLAIGIPLSIESCDNIAISIDDISNLGNKYFALMNKDYIVCNECGKLVKRNGKNDGTSKYCNKCSDIISRNKTKVRVRNFRSKNCEN